MTKECIFCNQNHWVLHFNKLYCINDCPNDCKYYAWYLGINKNSLGANKNSCVFLGNKRCWEHFNKARDIWEVELQSKIRWAGLHGINFCGNADVKVIKKLTQEEINDLTSRAI
jgi:hypothetical protein